MDQKTIDKLVEKILNVDEADTYGDRGGTRKKIDARTQPYSEPEKPINYRDWIKQQPKPKAIGMRKIKPKSKK